MKKIMIICTACYLQAPIAQAQIGMLDPTFGNNGYVTTGFGNNFNRAMSVAINNEGKIFAAGSAQELDGDDFKADFAVAKYNEDGSLDTGFGNNGLVITDFDNQSSDVAMAIAILDNGKIVVAGRSHAGMAYEDYHFAIVRYNQDGTLDQSFGVQGKVLYPFESIDDYSYKISMALQDDGKIVLTGTCYENSFDIFLTVRFTTDGQIDSTFGINGEVKSFGETFFGYPNAIKIQPDGKILVGGLVQGPISYPTAVDFALVRYEPDGTYDTSFGIDGIVLTPVNEGSGYDWIEDLEILSDGKIIALGNTDVYSTGSNTYRVALVKYHSDGTLDNSFGTSGIVLADFGSSYPYSTSVAVTGNNDILVNGNWMDLNEEYDFLLAKFSANGVLIQDFGENGITISNINPLEGGIDVTIQNDGKIVAAGLTGDPTYHDFAVLRYVDYIVPGNPELEQDYVVELFPDPATDHLIVRFPDYKNTNLKIMNVRGQQLFYSTITKSDHCINLRNLTPGIYFVILEKNNVPVFHEKIIKK